MAKARGVVYFSDGRTQWYLDISNNRRVILSIFPADLPRPDQSRALQRGLVFTGTTRHLGHVQQAQRYHRGMRAVGADPGAPALRAAHESLPDHLVLPAAPRDR